MSVSLFLGLACVLVPVLFFDKPSVADPPRAARAGSLNGAGRGGRANDVCIGGTSKGDDRVARQAADWRGSSLSRQSKIKFNCKISDNVLSYWS